MDGWELLVELRKEKSTPVLMLTARDAVPDRVRGLDAGADDYLTKPFDFDELLARLRALARRDRGVASNVVAVGEYSIDLSSKTLTGESGPISLTAREFVLVEHLALKRGSVVSRTELYEHLFDEDDDSLSNLLDVHVSNIRKKLGAEFILTKRGHGYYIS
jgi:two-component system OmpR family response regulator